jgi:hypothetical protein
MYVTVNEASRIVGKSKQTIYEMIWRGLLKVKKNEFNTIKYINLAELNSILEVK